MTGTSTAVSPYTVSSVSLTIKDTTNNTYWNGTAWQAGNTSVTATGTTSWSYALANSNFTTTHSYSITANITDSANNTASSTASTFTYDTTAPTSAVTYPTNASTLGTNYTGTLTGTASAKSPYTVSSVSLTIKDTTNSTYWNGTTWNSTSTNTVPATGTTSWSYALANSNFTTTHSYSITANITDSANNTASSTASTFTYDTTAPTNTITTPANSSTVGINYSTAWSGTAAAKASGASLSAGATTLTIQRSSDNFYWVSGTTWQAGSANVSTSGTTAWTATGPAAITVGLTYTVKATTTDSYTNVSAITTSTFTDARPNAPTGVTATPVTGIANGSAPQMTVAWTAATVNGGGAISNYGVDYSTNGTSWTVATAAATGTSYTISSGLSAGTSYYIRVSALSNLGWSYNNVSATNQYGFVSSTNTSPGTTTTAITAPAAPASVTMTQPAFSVYNVVVTWVAGNTGGSSSVTYTASLGGKSCTATNATTCTVASVPIGYYNTDYGTGASVTASSTLGGSGPAKATAAATPLTVYTAPQAPTTPSVSVGNMAATISFTSSSFNPGTYVSYVAVASPGGATCSVGAGATGLGAAGSCTITGLQGYSSNGGGAGNGDSYTYTFSVYASDYSPPDGGTHNSSNSGSTGGTVWFSEMHADSRSPIMGEGQNALRSAASGGNYFTQQSDGNLVWYSSLLTRSTGYNNYYGTAYVVLQKTDSNLVQRVYTGTAIWANGVSNTTQGSLWLTAQTDGYLGERNWGYLMWSCPGAGAGACGTGL